MGTQSVITANPPIIVVGGETEGDFHSETNGEAVLQIGRIVEIGDRVPGPGIATIIPGEPLAGKGGEYMGGAFIVELKTGFDDMDSHLRLLPFEQSQPCRIVKDRRGILSGGGTAGKGIAQAFNALLHESETGSMGDPGREYGRDSCQTHRLHQPLNTTILPSRLLLFLASKSFSHSNRPDEYLGNISLPITTIPPNPRRLFGKARDRQSGI